MKFIEPKKKQASKIHATPASISTLEDAVPDLVQKTFFCSGTVNAASPALPSTGINA